MTEILNVIYFISDGDYVKIGKADDLTERLVTITTHNPRDIKILATIKVGKNNIFKEERLAHEFFENYRIKGEWFSKDILPLLPDYIKKRNGFILNLEEKYLNRKQTMVATLEGLKPINSFRPRCHFFPHLPAQIKGKAGPGETYRTILFKGKRVFISGSFWNIYRELLKNYDYI